MASIDMSDVLLDPDFLDTAVCVRRTEVVGANGVPVRTTVDTPFLGCFISESSTMTRTNNAEQVSSRMTCVTVFRLMDGRNGQTADIVKFKGLPYTVSNVADFSNYGPGFVDAILELLPADGGPVTA